MKEIQIAHDWVLENYEKQKYIDSVSKNGSSTQMLTLLRNNVSYFSNLDLLAFRSREYSMIPALLNVS